MNPFTAIAVGGFCLGVSAMLSGMEAGLFQLNRLRLRHLKRGGWRRAELLHRYLEQPEPFLWTILVGNVMANFIALGIAGVVLRRFWNDQPAAFWSSYLLLVLAMYLLCDLLPKMLFRMYPLRLCLWFVTPFRYLSAGLTPATAAMTALTRWLLRWSGGRTFTGSPFGSREEMRLVMQESARNLSSEENTMISRVLDLPSASVRQIVVPLEQVVMVEASTPMREVMALWRSHRFSRLPVWRQEGARRVVIGIVSLKTVLYQADLDEQRPVQEFIKPALYLEADLRLETALNRMQRSGQRLAIVLDKDQRELGILSLQHILKFIFGEVNL